MQLKLFGVTSLDEAYGKTIEIDEISFQRNDKNQLRQNISSRSFSNYKSMNFWNKSGNKYDRHGGCGNGIKRF